jgi:catechol 2,3-dioxygenase-like lactoylglutathione lyase family enzyme
VANPIPFSAIHHLDLTVTDVDRARAFYTEVLGFRVTKEMPPAVVLGRGDVVLGLVPAKSGAGDRFAEQRVGLDHLSFRVAGREDLEQAARIFDDHGVPHGEIEDTAELKILVLAFRDPDNIQLELTAPYG